MKHGCRVTMHLLILWPWPLTFQPQNHVTSSHSMYRVWTLCNHSFLSYAADKQTIKQTNRQINKQTAWNSYPRRPTESAWVIIKIQFMVRLFMHLWWNEMRRQDNADNVNEIFANYCRVVDSTREVHQHRPLTISCQTDTWRCNSTDSPSV